MKDTQCDWSTFYFPSKKEAKKILKEIKEDPWKFGINPDCWTVRIFPCYEGGKWGISAQEINGNRELELTLPNEEGFFFSPWYNEI